jgi:hypothetical protein
LSSVKVVTAEDIGDAMKRMKKLGFSVNLIFLDEFASVIVDKKKERKPFVFR